MNVVQGMLLRVAAAVFPYLTVAVFKPERF